MLSHEDFFNEVRYISEMRIEHVSLMDCLLKHKKLALSCQRSPGDQVTLSVKSCLERIHTSYTSLAQFLQPRPSFLQLNNSQSGCCLAFKT
jgi:hypothetical protein